MKTSFHPGQSWKPVNSYKAFRNCHSYSPVQASAYGSRCERVIRWPAISAETGEYYDGQYAWLADVLRYQECITDWLFYCIMKTGSHSVTSEVQDHGDGSMVSSKLEEALQQPISHGGVRLVLLVHELGYGSSSLLSLAELLDIHPASLATHFETFNELNTRKNAVSRSRLRRTSDSLCLRFPISIYGHATLMEKEDPKSRARNSE